MKSLSPILLILGYLSYVPFAKSQSIKGDSVQFTPKAISLDKGYSTSGAVPLTAIYKIEYNDVKDNKGIPEIIWLDIFISLNKRVGYCITRPDGIENCTHKTYRYGIKLKSNINADFPLLNHINFSYDFYFKGKLIERKSDMTQQKIVEQSSPIRIQLNMPASEVINEKGKSRYKYIDDVLNDITIKNFTITNYGYSEEAINYFNKLVEADFPAYNQEKAIIPEDKNIVQEQSEALEKQKSEEKAVAESKQKAESERKALEKQKLEEKAIAESKQKAESERKALEKQKSEEKAVAESKQKAESEREALEKQKSEEKAVAESKQKAESERKALEKQKLEEKAIAESKQKAESERKALEKQKLEEKAIAESKQKAESERKVLEKQKLEEKAIAESKQKAESERKALEKQKLEEKAIAESKQKAESERKSLEKQKLEEKAVAESEQKAEAERKALEKQKLEEKAVAESKQKAESERKSLEKQKLEEKAVAESEQKAEAERKALEKQKLEEKAVAESEQKAEAERKALEKQKLEEKAVAESEQKAEAEHKALEKQKLEEKAVAESKQKAESEREALEKQKLEEKAVAESEQKAEAERKALEKQKLEEKAVAESKQKAEAERKALEKQKTEEKSIPKEKEESIATVKNTKFESNVINMDSRSIGKSSERKLVFFRLAAKALSPNILGGTAEIARKRIGIVADYTSLTETSSEQPRQWYNSPTNFISKFTYKAIGPNFYFNRKGRSGGGFFGIRYQKVSIETTLISDLNFSRTLSRNGVSCLLGSSTGGLIWFGFELGGGIFIGNPTGFYAMEKGTEKIELPHDDLFNTSNFIPILNFKLGLSF